MLKKYLFCTLSLLAYSCYASNDFKVEQILEIPFQEIIASNISQHKRLNRLTEIKKSLKEFILKKEEFTLKKEEPTCNKKKAEFILYILDPDRVHSIGNNLKKIHDEKFKFSWFRCLCLNVDTNDLSQEELSTGINSLSKEVTRLIEKIKGIITKNEVQGFELLNNLSIQYEKRARQFYDIIDNLETICAEKVDGASLLKYLLNSTPPLEEPLKDTMRSLIELKL